MKIPLLTVIVINLSFIITGNVFAQNDTAKYNNIQFNKGSLNFEYKKYKAPTKFKHAVFNGVADFKNVTFYNEVTFESARFCSDVSFAISKFKKFANFTRATFTNSMNFAYLEPRDTINISFYQAILPDIIDISQNPKFSNEVDFTKCNFDSTQLYTEKVRRWHYINVFGTPVSKIKIDYQHFRLCFYNNLYLPNKDFKVVSDAIFYKKKKYLIKNQLDKLYDNADFQDYIYHIFPYSKVSSDASFFSALLLSFKSNPNMNDYAIKEFIENCIQNKLFPQNLSEEEIISIYERELNNFEAQGQKTSYKNLDIEYRNFNPEKSSWLFYVWNCYGYHKEWVFIWAILFLVVFISITFVFFERLTTIYPIENIPAIIYSSLREAMTFNDKMTLLKRKLWYSIIFTSLIFFLIKLETNKLKLSSGWIVYIIIVYLSGIACLAYIANFVIQK